MQDPREMIFDQWSPITFKGHFGKKGSLGDGAGFRPPAWVGPFVVLAKTGIIVFFFFWIRATLPRLRYDQLMSFGWKILLPLATLNALVTAVLVVTLD